MSARTGDEHSDRHLGRPSGDTRKGVWRAEDWERLSREERRKLVGWELALIDADAREALDAETLGLRGEEHVSRIVSEVDELGWLELARIQDDALMASLAVKAESAERLSERGDEGIPVVSAMLCFQMPRRPTED